MGKRASFAAAAVVIGAWSFVQLAPAAQGAADPTFESTVSLRVDGSFYSGKVRSREYGCEARRGIKLLIVQRGRDRKLADVTTNAQGNYETQVLAVKRGTVIRAKAKYHLENEFECAAASSKPEKLRLGQVADVGSAVSMRVKDGEIFGQVTSAEAACQANRTVVVVLVRKGKDGTLGKTGTDPEGRWTLKSASAEDGTKLRAGVRNGFTPEFNCLKATSPVRVFREPKGR